MNLIIARYFTKDEQKGNDMIYEIIGQINLKEKNNMFAYALKPRVSEADIKEITKSIDRITDARNQFAHYPIDYTTLAQSDFKENRKLHFQKLKIAKFEGKREIGIEHIITEEWCTQLINHIEAVNSGLRILLETDPSSSIG
jgi:hypothetical protein